MPTCHVLRSSKIEMRELARLLHGRSEARIFEELPGQRFADRIDNVSLAADGTQVRFIFTYHRLVLVESSVPPTAYVKIGKSETMVVDPPEENTWFVHGTRADATATTVFVRVHVLNRGVLTPIAIGHRVMLELRREEARTVYSAAFEDLNANIKEATLRGDLRSEARLHEYERQGTYRQLRYLSRSKPVRIRVRSSGGVTMTGRGATPAVLEQYIQGEILPRVRALGA